MPALNRGRALIFRSSRTRSWRHRLSLWWRDLEWPAVVTMALLAIWLGYVGFSKNAAALAEARTPWDLFYLALQLFVLQSGAVSGPVSWQLEVARLLAPGVAGYAACKALAAILQEQVQLFRMRFLRDHVIICGLGQKGLLLAQGFRSRGEPVVVVDADAGDPLLGACRKAGAIVLSGNASDDEVLRQARVHRARYLFAFYEDDRANAEIAMRVRELVTRQRTTPLTCYIHIFDAKLHALLRAQRGALQAGQACRLEFSNIFDTAARMLLEAHPPFAAPGDTAPPRLLVIGLGRLGESLLVRAAMDHRRRVGATGNPLPVTIVDKEVTDRLADLQLRHPWLAGACELLPVQMDVCSSEFRGGEFLFDAAGHCRATMIYICVDDDLLCLSVALDLRQRLRGCPVTIIARMAEDGGLATLLHGMQAGLNGATRLHAFALPDQVCRPALILDGTCEVMARAIHDAYVRHQQSLGQSVQTNPSMVAWEQLPDVLKESNRLQADDAARKLAAVGCGIEPLTDWDAAEAFTFSAEEVEKLSEMEHERWMEERRAKGWTYAPGRRNLQAKTSPYLVPWCELGDDIKAYDRDAVRLLPAALLGAGLQAYRLIRAIP